VLVDTHGTALLTDFGLSRMMEDSTLWNTTASVAKGTIRWMAPELLDGTVQTVTKEADIWAFGMTAYVRNFRNFKIEGASLTLS
jgi:serine/threonine protein kinase